MISPEGRDPKVSIALRCNEISRTDDNVVGPTSWPVTPQSHYDHSCEATPRNVPGSYRHSKRSTIIAQPVNTSSSGQVNFPSRISRASRTIEPKYRTATIQHESDAPRRFTLAEVTTTRRPEPVGLPELHVNESKLAEDPDYGEFVRKARLQDQSRIEVYEDPDGEERR